jgi:hypothetical protein
MKTKFWLQCILSVILASYGNCLLAHDIPVHWAITFHAQESARDNSSSYVDFLSTISSDISFVQMTNSMVAGGGTEDNRNVNLDGGVDVGGARSMNHFYDPIHKSGGKAIGLTISPLGAVGRNSFDWGSISNETGVDVGFPVYNKGVYNIWSWQNARGYERSGLTSTDPIVRSNNLVNMFRSVGQVMHLLEDASQPQHVRNEQHLDQISIFDAWSRSVIEDYGKKHVAELIYTHSMLDWRGGGFIKLEDFWDRHLYNGNLAALNGAENGGAQLGLAEWCNGNFIGQRATYAEFFAPDDLLHFPFPSLANTTQPGLKQGNLWGTAVHGDVTLENLKQGTRLYIAKNPGAGVSVSNHSALSYLIAKHPGKGGGLPVLTIDDENVLLDYHNLLIPKAVKYSAGLIDYFFRGDISISSFGFDTNNLMSTNLVLNTSGQNLSGGAFHLFYDDSSGIRSEITNGFSTTYSVSLSSNASVTIVFPKTNAVKYLLVYQGSIGTTDPVDNGIGLIAKSFIIGTNVWGNSFENGGNSEPSQGTYFSQGWHVDSGNVDVELNGWQGGGVPVAYEGTNFLDLDGSEPGTISTNVSTTIGQTYELTFAWCRNPDSTGGGGLSQPVHVPSAQVLVGNNVVMTMVGSMGNSWANLQWQQASCVFIATASSTKLTFHSLDDSSSLSGIQLDAIYLKMPD